jgi:excisionase family DNA binding protein
MAETLALSVPEAAARLGLSERTIWRQIHSGELKTRRNGRRVMVLVQDVPWPGLELAGGHRSAETAAPYEPSRHREVGRDWQVGPFPYTAAVVERHRRARLARRRAAVAEIKRLASLSKPDPDGLTAADYVRAERDHPRALEGGDAADRALEKMARDRRRRR